MIVTQKILAQQLADACNLSVEKADKFVSDFFATIEDALVDEGEVRIKGLGRFFLVNDEIKFIPTDELASTVNAPFAFFAPMLLHDDELVEESDLTTVNDIIAEPKDESEAKPESARKSLPEPQEEIVAEEPVREEPEDEPVADMSAELEVEVEEEPEDEIEEQPQSEPVEQQSEPVEPQIVHHYHHRSGFSILSFVLIFVAGLIIGALIAYFAHDNIAVLINGKPEIAPKQSVVIDADTVTIVRPNSVFVEKQKTPDTLKTDTNSIKADEFKSFEQKVTEPDVKPKRYDTVGGRIYLATLARKYYGRGEYWVYIFEANKLKHPDRIKPGTKLLIPYIEDVRTSKDDSINLANAKRRGAEIYAKCK